MLLARRFSRALHKARLVVRVASSQAPGVRARSGQGVSAMHPIPNQRSDLADGVTEDRRHNVKRDGCGQIERTYRDSKMDHVSPEDTASHDSRSAAPAFLPAPPGPEQDCQNDRPNNAPADPRDVWVSRLPFEDLLMDGHGAMSVPRRVSFSGASRFLYASTLARLL